jgi:hypothetical protein
MKRVLRFKKRTWVLTAIVAAVAAMASIGAYAYWTATGTGSGSATTGTITAGITVNQVGSPSGLYPGGPAQPLSGDFSNANSGNAWVTSVTASLQSVTMSGSAVVDAGHPACTTADFQLNNPTTLVGQDITPGPANGSWSGPSVQLLNTASNQDNCKNATLNISYTSN